MEVALTCVTGRFETFAFSACFRLQGWVYEHSALFLLADPHSAEKQASQILFLLKDLPQNSLVYTEKPVNSAQLSPFKKFRSPMTQILKPPKLSPKTSLFIKFPLKIFHCLESSCTPVLAQMRSHLQAQVFFCLSIWG